MNLVCSHQKNGTVVVVVLIRFIYCRWMSGEILRFFSLFFFLLFAFVYDFHCLQVQLFH